MEAGDPWSPWPACEPSSPDQTPDLGDGGEYGDRLQTPVSRSVLTHPNSPLPHPEVLNLMIYRYSSFYHLIYE